MRIQYRDTAGRPFDSEHLANETNAEMDDVLRRIYRLPVVLLLDAGGAPYAHATANRCDERRWKSFLVDIEDCAEKPGATVVLDVDDDSAAQAEHADSWSANDTVEAFETWLDRFRFGEPA